MAIITYKGLSVLTAAVEAGGVAINDNFYYIADRLDVDTLSSVTGRGATTTTAISLQASSTTFGKQDTANIPGQIKLIAAGNNSAYYTTITAGTNSGNLSITLPTAAPGGTYLLNMTTGGIIGYDTNTYLTSLSGALLATGSVTGATSQAQTFTNGVIYGDGVTQSYAALSGNKLAWTDATDTLQHNEAGSSITIIAADSSGSTNAGSLTIKGGTVTSPSSLPTTGGVTISSQGIANVHSGAITISTGGGFTNTTQNANTGNITISTGGLLDNTGRTGTTGTITISTGSIATANTSPTVGPINITAGDTSRSTGAGVINISGGGSGGTGGAVNINGGTSSNGTGGAVNINGGNENSGGWGTVNIATSGGPVVIGNSSISTTANAGAITIKGGTTTRATGVATGGVVAITGGGSYSGAAGNISLTGGASTNGGTAGTITITGGTSSAGGGTVTLQAGNNGSGTYTSILLNTSGGDIKINNDTSKLFLGAGDDVCTTYTGTVWDFYVAQATSEIVFNNNAVDTDFRIESASNANMVVVDAGTNKVSIGAAAPNTELDVTGTISCRNGNFSTARDAEYFVTVLRNSTTDATQTELFINGSSTRITLSDQDCLHFTANIVGRRTNADDEGAAWTIQGCIDRNGSTTALVGAILKTVIAKDDVDWDVTAVADDTNDGLAIKVTGKAGRNINWVASVQITRVNG